MTPSPSTSGSLSDAVDGSVEGKPVAELPVIAVVAGKSHGHLDQLAVEEPLAITIAHGPLGKRQRTTLSITMRTPGNDCELAAGFLLAEGVISQPGQILALEPGRSALRVDLHPEVVVELARLDRIGYTSSACGLCGKTSIDAVEAMCDGPNRGKTPFAAALIYELPARLREAQSMFDRTGGLHAAALFDWCGQLLAVREDVGRHNAVDKLMGAELLANRLPLSERLLLVSGRAGFELIQKAALAGIPVFAAVGAPSSLAVSLAQRLGMTLIGFLRENRFNIYSGAERIAT